MLNNTPMQQTTVAVIALIMLIIGLVGGYALGTNHMSAVVVAPAPDMHQMSNGMMMSNSHDSMDMGAMMSSMNAEIKGKTGAEFEKAFLSEMIVHHQGAVEMAQTVLQKTTRPELVKLANDIITAQNSEITMMQQWQRAWFDASGKQK